MKNLILALLLVVVGTLGCATHVQRTPLNKWGERSFKKVGVRIELPKGISSSDTWEDEKTLYIFMHKVVHPWYYLRDSTPLVEIEIRRSTVADMNRDREALEKYGPPWSAPGYYYPAASEDERQKNYQLRKLLLDPHPRTTRIEGAHGMIFFRKDVACPDAQVLHGEILWRSGVEPDPGRAGEDESGLLRILDSMRAL